MNLKFALVGCGRIAVRHAELLGGGHIDNALLVAVCDININKAMLLGQKYNVPYYTDMHTMMKDINIDVVVVLTESGNHAKHVIELSIYRKDIVVEKPMALTLKSADEMIKACDNNGCRLFVVKQNRFNLPVQKLKSELLKGRFGKLVLGTVRVRWCRTQEYYNQDNWRGTWKFDGGVITNQASHHIDLLEWMMGDVDSLFAYSKTALADIETEDTAVVILNFSNGALGAIEATTATRPIDLEGSLSILGENGSVVISGFAVNKLDTWKFSVPLEEDAGVFDKYSENPPNVYGFGHRRYYESVVNCILKDGPNLVDGFEGRRSLELINAIYESIETGRQIDLKFKPKKCKLGILDDEKCQ